MSEQNFVTGEWPAFLRIPKRNNRDFEEDAMAGSKPECSQCIMSICTNPAHRKPKVPQWIKAAAQEIEDRAAYKYDCWAIIAKHYAAREVPAGDMMDGGEADKYYDADKPQPEAREVAELIGKACGWEWDRPGPSKVPEWLDIIEREFEPLMETVRVVTEEHGRLRAERDNYLAQSNIFCAEQEKLREVLARTHVALGGDGKWGPRLASTPPTLETGDLAVDVPVLAAQVNADRNCIRKQFDTLTRLAALKKEGSD